MGPQPRPRDVSGDVGTRGVFGAQNLAHEANVVASFAKIRIKFMHFCCYGQT